MTTPPAIARTFADLTWPEVAALDPERTVLVLPVSATEQHGPHLPLSVDAEINRGIVRQAMEIMPPELTASFLPELVYGRSEEHQGFPGTLTIEPGRLAHVWHDIGRSLARAGLRKLVIFNSHGGQPQVVDFAARRLRIERGLLVVQADWWRLAPPAQVLPAGSLPETELRHGIHGGAVETSMMLHLRPDLVRRERFADFRPASADWAETYRHLNAVGPTPFAWMTQDLHETGACGDPRLASADLGERLVAAAAEALVRLVQETADFPLSNLRQR
ncbi:creatinine amidohydrolase [Tistlia consotensis]|uniref:Creatinine amidohydrolase n=1 Tax=Tistlia consotensis USBA 355 TaxID=560819 RepID=A0A1Y6BHV1_9PROT|nr:creatininase family protein [Tistlia consotensis]SMF11984.1 creatinine amidohydrolase [Tistlia consotensis USBA 355]SNR51463.1 creatinine amidohydrolase [Tistlia consotensis]